MLHDIYQNLPLQIDPIMFTIGSFAVRWYALSYLAGFLVAYVVLRWRVQRGEGDADFRSPGLIADFLLISFFAALIGGRIGYVLFYNGSYFFANPLLIFSPYNPEGVFVGIYGMSYHGALLGILLSSYFFLRKRKINFLAWADFVAPAVALGYFFGRIGNFLNGELYGRITSSFWGMHFLADPSSLRHPSQLYEAMLEGLLLFLILWQIRNAKLKRGCIFALYLVGYGVLRILAEQFRQPDAQIGFLFGHFTIGQLLSLLMVIFGLVWIVAVSRKEKG